MVGTPGRLAQHVREGNLDLSTSLQMLVIDEADLIFSFGFEADLRYILAKLPPIYQVRVASIDVGRKWGKRKGYNRIE